MGDCGCGKRTSPTGYGTSERPASTSEERSRANAIANANRVPRVAPTGTAAAQSYALQMPNGQVRNVGSLLEARAEERRGGTILPS